MIHNINYRYTIDVEFNKIDDNDDNFINDIKYKFIELNIDDDCAINISPLAL